MSRVGKNPINIPQGVTVNLEGSKVTVKGSKGELSTDYRNLVVVEQKDNQIIVSPKGKDNSSRAFWGTFRALINNLVLGVTNGFSKELEVNGVGYRAAVNGQNLVLNLGYSHDIKYQVPEGIKITCPEPTKIIIEGADKQKVGQVAAEIRSYRKPEPYKGKGIKYKDERIVRKEGKKK